MQRSKYRVIYWAVPVLLLVSGCSLLDAATVGQIAGKVANEALARLEVKTADDIRVATTAAAAEIGKVQEGQIGYTELGGGILAAILAAVGLDKRKKSA